MTDRSKAKYRPSADHPTTEWLILSAALAANEPATATNAIESLSMGLLEPLPDWFAVEGPSTTFVDQSRSSGEISDPRTAGIAHTCPPCSTKTSPQDSHRMNRASRF